MLKVREIDGAVKGRFSDGNPDYDYVGATKVSDYWLNAVQFELVNLVEFTGQKLDEKKETQLATAIRKMSGFDAIINSDYFAGKSEEEKTRMNEVGLFESLEDLPKLLKNNSKVKIQKLKESTILGPIVIESNNVTVQFSSDILLKNGGEITNYAFELRGDGIQIEDVRTKGFDIPFKIQIDDPQNNRGFAIIDRCLGIGSSNVVSVEDATTYKILFSNSNVL